MSTRTSTIYLCDPCLQMPRPREREGVEVSVTIGRRRKKPVTLCDQHRTRLLDPLMSVLAEIKG